MNTRGRKTRPEIKLGICGEQGGDPATVEFCYKVGLTYVSCSPFRVPIARLALEWVEARPARAQPAVGVDHLQDADLLAVIDRRHGDGPVAALLRLLGEGLDDRQMRHVANRFDSDSMWMSSSARSTGTPFAA